MAHYGTIAGGDTYFSTKLGAENWDAASSDDKTRALTEATQDIDFLNFKGFKNPVSVLLDSNSNPTQAQLHAADAEQELQFPRGIDTTVPTAVENAAYEIALGRLSGLDPDTMLDEWGVQSEAFSSVSVTYRRDAFAPRHLAEGIVSPIAWRLLRPYLKDPGELRLSRV